MALIGEAQEFLGLQESPAASGLFTSHETGSYSGIGLNNGVTWLFNAEGGDRVSVAMQTTLTTNSYPRIQISTSEGANLFSTVGTVEGFAQVENFAIETPGVYRVTAYSNNAPSAFSLDVLFGRGVELESGDNSLRASAGPLAPKLVGGGFSAAVAGTLNHEEDWFDLGELAPGNTVDFNLETPASSALQTSAAEIALFRDDDVAPLASATGGNLSHNVAVAGRYRIRATMPGPDGRYLQFNGDSDQIDLGNPAPLQILGSQTIEFWIKPDHLNARQNPYSKAYGGEGTMTLETSGVINYYYGTGGGNGGSYQTFSSNSQLQVGRWQHLALVRDLDSEPKQLRWYLDGKLVSEATAQYAAATVSSLNALIGTGYAGAFSGSLDEFRIWNVARTQAEIQAGRVAPLVGNEAGLVAYYQFNEESGNVVNDLSNSGISGVITGSPDRAGVSTATLAGFTSQGPDGSYLLRGTIGDVVAPSVITRAHPVPISPQLFDGTTPAPSNMTALRGNVGQSFLYSLSASSSGSAWGTEVYRDDSNLARAAIHAGVLMDGEVGAVKVTVLPGEAFYEGSSRFGVSSSSHGAFAGSYRVERYEPPSAFTWDEIYPRLWIGFSEPIDPVSLAAAGAVTLASAGADGTFGNSDDEDFPLTFGPFTWDNRAFFSFNGAILPPGDYRLTIGTQVKDRAGNSLASAHMAEFTIVGKGNFLAESGDNETFATADRLSLAVQDGVTSGSFIGVDPAVAVSSNPFDVETAD
ncbi:LamG-like jellyroll fold domain-containing protein, partial [Haloferula chungangensis]